MKQLENKELKNIRGGGFSFWTGVTIIGFITFISGIIDGIARPLDCK